MTYATVAAITAAMLAPLVAYITAARKMSGRIETSDAEALWREAAALRDQYQREIAELHARIRECETEIREARDALDVARRELRAALAENTRLAERIRTLEAA